VTVCHGIDGTVVDKNDEFLDEIYPIDASQLDDGDTETFDEISENDISKSDKHLFVGGATLKVSNKNVNGKQSELAQVDNPYYNEEMVKYFDSTLAGKLPIWCGSLIHCKECQTHASNNSSEGIIKWYKSDPEFQLHRSDLALYLHYAWNKHLERDRVFGLNVDGLKSAVDRYNNRANKFNCSQDAMEVEAENSEESRWGKARWDTEGPQR
jgi:hypothetical protein